MAAKVALIACSAIALNGVAKAESVPANGDIAISASTYTVAETAGSVTITAERRGGTTGSVSVTYSTQNMSAVAGTAFTAKTGTLTWASGDGTNKTFAIPITNTGAKTMKRFLVIITSVGGTLIGVNNASVNIEPATAAAVVVTKSISQWVSCSESVDETAQFKSALAAAANNAFTLVIDCPVRFHTGFSSATPVAVPNGVTMQFEGSGELITTGVGLTIANLSEVTFVDFNMSDD